MKPFIHAHISAKKFGGKPSDYQSIHDFIDSTKAHHADVRHRALLHSSWGCFLVEKVFGITMVNSDGREFSTRDIAEQHILDDLGSIPSVSHWLNNMAFQPWMGGHVRSKARQYQTLPRKDKV
jgi:hypothetical protein